MTDEWRSSQLGELMELAVSRVQVHASQEYPIVGVLNRGRGVLRREPIRGAQTKYRELHRVDRGMVLYSKLKAFEGAVAVALDGDFPAFASPEFPTFRCGTRLTPEFFALVTQLPAFWSELSLRSTGMGGRRERVSPRQFLDIALPTPPVDVQRRIVDLIHSIDEHIANLQTETDALQSVLVAARIAVFERWDWVSLSSVCSIAARLVDPKDPQYAGLPHIGIDKIEKETGALLPLQSAAEEGVISGKYLFERGDVVFSKIRPNLKKVTVPDFDGLCSADAYPLRPAAGLPPSLLREALLLPDVVAAIVAKSGRTKMPKINRTELFAIEVPLDASPEDWSHASALLESLEAARRALAAELSTLHRLRDQTVNAVLSGEVVLPEAYDRLVDAGVA